MFGSQTLRNSRRHSCDSIVRPPQTSGREGHWAILFRQLTFYQAPSRAELPFFVEASRRPGAKRGQAPLPERPGGCYAQRCLTPFRTRPERLHAGKRDSKLTSLEKDSWKTIPED